MTFILGITGGIASGKTTATKTLESLGVEIVDADIIARNVVSNDYSNNSSALAKIVDHFGPAILLASDELDRARLRDIIFADPTEKRWLENLLHPIVRKQIIQQLSAIKSPYGVLSSPLLFEKEQQELVNHTLVIDVPIETQNTRAILRDNVNQQQINNIMDTQLSREERNKKADDIISNTGNIEELQEKITVYHKQLINKITAL